MTTLQIAAHQALEALEYGGLVKKQQALTALRAALAQEQAEPVAKVELMTTGGNAGLATRIVEIDNHLRERLRPGQLLYTAPPRRTMVPLTEEEIFDAFYAVKNATPISKRHGLSVLEIARLVEKASWEKNNG